MSKEIFLDTEYNMPSPMDLGGDASNIASAVRFRMGVLFLAKT